MDAMSIFGLERAFAPKSVAVVGGSRRPSSLGAAVLKNLQAGGFKGPIAVINPHYPEVGGQPTYCSLSAVPFTPDLVVITSPAPTIPEIIAEAGARGVAAAVILSSGLGHGEGSPAEAARRAAREAKL